MTPTQQALLDAIGVAARGRFSPDVLAAVAAGCLKKGMRRTMWIAACDKTWTKVSALRAGRSLEQLPPVPSSPASLEAMREALEALVEDDPRDAIFVVQVVAVARCLVGINRDEWLSLCTVAWDGRTN